MLREKVEKLMTEINLTQQLQSRTRKALKLLKELQEKIDEKIRREKQKDSTLELMLGATLHERGFSSIETISNGSFGTIYKAKLKEAGSQESARVVAIKVPSKDGVKPLYQEIAALEQLKALSRNYDGMYFVRYLSKIELPTKVPMVVMDYYPMDLDKFIRSVAPNEDQLKFMAFCLLRAAELAHSFKLYHLDIKPGNILLNESYMPFLTDWGLSG
jgi:serine/threonine protein kinase